MRGDGEEGQQMVMLDSRCYPDASTVRSFRFPAGPWSMVHARLGPSGLGHQQRTAQFPRRGALAVPTSPRIAAAPVLVRSRPRSIRTVLDG